MGNNDKDHYSWSILRMGRRNYRPGRCDRVLSQGALEYVVGRDRMEVDWIRISPFNESGDETFPESFPGGRLTKCREKSQNETNAIFCRAVRS
jgi:hypothetical protein